MPRLQVVDRLEIERLAILRDAIPSDKELAQRYGCSVSTIKSVFVEVRRKTIQRLVPHETIGAHHPQT